MIADQGWGLDVLMKRLARFANIKLLADQQNKLYLQKIFFHTYKKMGQTSHQFASNILSFGEDCQCMDEQEKSTTAKLEQLLSS